MNPVESKQLAEHLAMAAHIGFLPVPRAVFNLAEPGLYAYLDTSPGLPEDRAVMIDILDDRLFCEWTEVATCPRGVDGYTLAMVFSSERPDVVEAFKELLDHTRTLPGSQFLELVY